MLMWDPVTQDVEDNPASPSFYEILRSDFNNGLSFEPIKAVAPQTGLPRQYTNIEGLNPDIVYNFQVTAVNTLDESSEPSEPATDF